MWYMYMAFSVEHKVIGIQVHITFGMKEDAIFVFTGRKTEKYLYTHILLQVSLFCNKEMNG